jgi:hypothetical protein
MPNYLVHVRKLPATDTCGVRVVATHHGYDNHERIVLPYRYELDHWDNMNYAALALVNNNYSSYLGIRKWTAASDEKSHVVILQVQVNAPKHEPLNGELDQLLKLEGVELCDSRNNPNPSIEWSTCK